MSDKTFDPVTEGTPKECAKHIEGYYGISPETELSQLESDIAARDAAKKAEGRREGLEEAAEIASSMECASSSWSESIGWGRALESFENVLRAAAETAKEGGE